MKIYEERLVSTFEKTLVKTVCDICKEEINIKDGYYEVTTGHNDWGSDSHESIKEFDICSDKCLQKEFDSYLKSSYPTRYIEIARE